MRQWSYLYMEGSYEKMLVLFLAIPVMAFFVDFFLARSIFGHWYRIFVAPGVILHELSHVFGCLITGTKVHNVSFFAKEGGSVEHQKSPFLIIGQIVISLAPLVIGALAIYLLARFVGVKEVNLSHITLSYNDVKRILYEMIISIDLSTYRDWSILYLIISIAVTMNPSRQDIKNIAFALFIFIIALFVLVKFTTYRPDLTNILPDKLLIILSTVDLLLILSLLLSIVVFAISRLLKPL